MDNVNICSHDRATGPDRCESAGYAGPALPRQLHDRVRAAAQSLPDFRRRWNLLRESAFDGSVPPESVLGTAETLYNDLDVMLWGIYGASEEACIEADDLGRGYPVPRPLAHAILKANLRGGEAADHWLAAFLPAERRQVITPRTLRSLALAFEALVGCLTDVLAAYVSISGACVAPGHEAASRPTSVPSVSIPAVAG